MWRGVLMVCIALIAYSAQSHAAALCGRVVAYSESEELTGIVTTIPSSGFRLYQVRSMDGSITGLGTEYNPAQYITPGDPCTVGTMVLMTVSDYDALLAGGGGGDVQAVVDELQRSGDLWLAALLAVLFVVAAGVGYRFALRKGDV